MGYTTDVLAGVAQLLDDAGLGTYRETGIYTASELGIVLVTMPPTPDRVICISPYMVEDNNVPDVIDAVQIRVRGLRDPRPLLDLGDALRDLLHNRRDTVLGSVHVSLIWRQSQGLLGQDAQGREELSANYYFRAARPGPHLYE